jgi:hypothetical protein
MDLTRVQELKQKLLQEAELAPVWLFFMNHFVDNPEFIALGERVSHPFVEAVVAEVGRQLFGGKGAVNNLLLTLIAEQQFIHGGFAMGGHLGGVIYFEDAQMGLVTVAEMPPSIDVKYARFSGKPIRKVPTPSVN